MYRMTDLVDATGLSKRTIEYYREKRILPPPVGGRRYATWTPAHLRILLDLVAKKDTIHRRLADEVLDVQSQYAPLFPPHERHPDLAR